MQLTQPSAVTIALGVVLALAALVVLVWHRRVSRLNSENPEERCRRDIEALRRGHRSRGTGLRSDDVWSAGAPSDPPHSRSKKAVAWVAVGSVGGCGGCGGCGCGG
jgi:membrane protein implicated in regulation of membrane protease activity